MLLYTLIQSLVLAACLSSCFFAKSKAVRAETKAESCHVKEQKANNLIPYKIKFRAKLKKINIASTYI
jgi:hypothetical protein